MIEVLKASIAAEHSEAVSTKDNSGGGGVFAGSPLFGPSSHEKEETELKTITRERPQSTTIAEPAAPSAWGQSASASIDTVAASIENRGPNRGAPDHTASRLFNQGDNLSREVSLRTNVESSDYDPFYTPKPTARSRSKQKAADDRGAQLGVDRTKEELTQGDAPRGPGLIVNTCSTASPEQNEPVTPPPNPAT